MTAPRPSSVELYLALGTIALATLAYAALARHAAPGSAVGLWLGGAGFALMLATQTLYSLRKRRPGFNLWPMGLWLRSHIFTGLVGPYLALLHSGWRFNGVAGVLMLLTAVVVLSGLVGRYVYTSVPRSLDATLAEIADIEDELDRLGDGEDAGDRLARHDELMAELRAWARTRWLLSTWHGLHVPLTGALFALAGVHILGALYYSTFSR